MGAFYLFESNLHLVVSWVLLVATISMCVWSVQKRQRHHLYWIVPLLVNDVVETLYRTLSALSLLPPAKSMARLLLMHICIDIADVCWALGTLALLFILKAGRLPDTASVSDPEVWPPAPGSR